MSDRIYTIEELKEALYPIFVEHNVKKAVIFGSYAKGKANESSDVDLLLDSGLRGLKFVGLIEDIRTALDKDVDVLDERHLKSDSELFYEISKHSVVIYELGD